MLHERHGQLDPPVGTGAGADAGASDGDRTGAWTGQKRRKTPSDLPPEPADQDPSIAREEEFQRCLAVLSTRRPPLTIAGPVMDAQRKREVFERISLYRIRASRIAQGVCIDQLDDTTLRKEYSPEALEEMFYNYQEDTTFDWYFDRDYARHACLSDYNRLVLKNGDDGTKYLDWEKYSTWFTSYETDEEYIKYFEEISQKIKWIKGYMECKRESPEWMEMEARGFQEAVKIAVDYPCISFDLAFTAYMDHIWNVRFDYVYCEGIDDLIFEIWERVTEQKIAFRDALQQVNQKNLFPRRKERIQFTLDNDTYSSLQFAFETCVEGITDDAPKGEAQRLITSAVWKKLPKRKTWNQYMMRKIEIARQIGLDLHVWTLQF